MNNEKEIELFIKWLSHFYLLSNKQKEKIIKKVLKKEKKFGVWLDSVKDFNTTEQFKLFKGLRCSNW